MTKKKEPSIEEITLKDFFACFAIHALISEPTLQATEQEFAERAYKVAQEMMEARKK